jgi:hypothetical protein
MLYFVIQFTILSIILIFLVHHLILFFKSTLTVPKIKDLVNTSNKQYENIYNIISNNNNSKNTNIDILNSENIYGYNESELLPPKPDIDSMKNELKDFLKTHLQNSQTSTTISSLDNFASY